MRFRRFLIVALAGALPGCASFAHGVWENRQEVFARLDDAANDVKESYGSIAYGVAGPGAKMLNAMLFLVFAGFSGAAHATQVPTDALGLTACESCALENLKSIEATSRPHP